MSELISQTSKSVPLGNSHNLDFLRAIAVLFVLFDHTLIETTGIHKISYWDVEWLGRAGVLFFFVHTCCVLMMSLARHGEGRMGLFGHFYLRRAFRIYPLAMLSVLVAFLAGIAPDMKEWEWASNFALIQNVTHARNCFGALWSLPLEVQMYIFLPFCFLFVRKYGQNLWLLLALWAASAVIALSPVNQVLSVPFPAFIPGVIAYALLSRGTERLPGWMFPIGIFLIVGAFQIHPTWRWPSWVTCLTLGLVIPRFRQIKNKVVNQTTAIIARYSYGIYLGHSLLLEWLKPTVRLVPLYLLAVAVVSFVVFHTIEHPMVRFANRVLDNATGNRVRATQPV